MGVKTAQFRSGSTHGGPDRSGRAVYRRLVTSFDACTGGSAWSRALITGRSPLDTLGEVTLLANC